MHVHPLREESTNADAGTHACIQRPWTLLVACNFGCRRYTWLHDHGAAAAIASGRGRSSETEAQAGGAVARTHL